MKCVFVLLLVVVVFAVVITAADARVRGRGRSRGACPDGGRWYPCFMWPCGRWSCASDSELTCVANYCVPGCGRLWENQSGDFVTCEREVRNRGRRRG